MPAYNPKVSDKLHKAWRLLNAAAHDALDAR